MRSIGLDADVMRPVATPIIRGMRSSSVIALVMTQVTILLMNVRDLKKGKLQLFGDEALMEKFRYIILN